MPNEPDPATDGPAETLLLGSQPISSPAQESSLGPSGDGGPTLNLDRCIGPYRLLELIGEGGMGEVWRAEQLQPVRRQVALKVIKAGMDTKQVVARFESERQALALMDHPAIAKVFDGGGTREGRPYFVMEYVSGLPLTEHCDTQRLSIVERLELFLEVCAGVQHAHQKAVIHRDLKPSNVLVAVVDGKAQPKIIDFGIAKATGQRLTERTLSTEAGAIIGTPEYMSPEQADFTGENVDTRTDVYSLGVILYELLTGSLPLGSQKLRSIGFEEFRRQLREVEPSRPSTRLSTLGDGTTDSAQKRDTDPSALRGRLEGDLDAMTLKALEKDPDRRYGTPSELAADVGRYLRDEPILARPPSRRYRARKYIRRHRLGVALASAFALLLLASSVSMVIQVRRIAYERDRANADLLRALSKTRVPDIEWLTRQRLDIQRKVLGPEHLETVFTTHLLANILMSQGRSAEAEKLQREALEIEQRILGPERAEMLGDTVRFAFGGDVTKRLSAVEKLHRQTLETQRRTLGSEHADTLRTIGDLASALVKEDHLAEAEALEREKLEAQQRVLGAEHPDTLQSMGRLAAIVFSEGRLGEAETLQRQTLEARRRVLGPGHPETVRAMGELANTFSREGRLAEAELIREAPAAGQVTTSQPRSNGRLAWAQLVPLTGFGIFTGRPDGTEVRQLTFPETGGFNDEQPSWSPDGSSLLFNRSFDRTDVVSRIYRIRADGSGLTEIGGCTGDCVGNFFSTYSPDGSKIAFIKGTGRVKPDGNIEVAGVWVMNSDGTNPIQMTQQRLPTTSEDRRPSWSPDGKTLAFTRENVSAEPTHTQAIFLLRIEGLKLQQLTPWNLDADFASWSPDGARILVSAHSGTGRPGKHELYMVHPDGSGLQKIAPRGLGEPNPRVAEAGKFSPDGRKIVFQHAPDRAAGDEMCCELYEMNTDGSGLVQLSHVDVAVYDPAWGTHP